MAQTETAQRRRRSLNLNRLFTTAIFRPWRAFVFPALGVIIGLFVVANALFKPFAPKITIVPPGYVALVNERPVLMSDYINELEQTERTPFAQATPEQKKKVLRSMIDQELLVQRSLVLDLPEMDTESREKLADAVTFVVSALAAANPPTDAELMEYFNAHAAQYQGQGIMQYQDIVLRYGGFQDADQTREQAEADAQEAVYQLRSGAQLDYVMQHFGFVKSGRSDEQEDFDFAAKLHLGNMEFAIAEKMRDGEFSDPITDKDGVHIIMMIHRVPPMPTDFATARDRVYSDYTGKKKADAVTNTIAMLRKNADIILAPGNSE